jgi:hypothetical protein
MNKSFSNLAKRYSFAALFFSLALFSCNRENPEPAGSKPSNLEYSPNAISLPSSSVGKSVTPNILGGTPIKYRITTNPDAGGNITIDSQTGIISVSSSAADGLYKVTVIAMNKTGSTNFTDIFTINIGTVTFEAIIKPIITIQCATCHVAGGNNTNYEIYSSAKSNINTILDRITRMQGSPGFMPRGRTGLSSADIALIEKWKTDGLIEK